MLKSDSGYIYFSYGQMKCHIGYGSREEGIILYTTLGKRELSDKIIEAIQEIETIFESSSVTAKDRPG